MSKWVTSWGVPTTYVVEGLGNYLDNTTFRNMFYNPIKGEKIRIRFSNAYGKEDVRIDAVSIGEWAGDGPKIKADTLKTFSFEDNGNLIKAGEELVTDALDYVLEPQKNYVVSYYFKELTPLATGYNKFTGDKFTPCWLARGNFTESLTIDIKYRLEIQHYAFFCSVEVLCDDKTKAVMAFGDSITARPWPDLLVRRINETGRTDVSVVREAIGGNRVLRDYRDCLPRRRMGIAAVERFEMALNQVKGAETVIMLEGINDIYHPMPNNPICEIENLPTAEELIEGYKVCCDIAHKHGAKFYLCTILPTAHMKRQGLGKEDIRNKVNDWIRNNDYIDGYVDFDKATADPTDPSLLKAEYDCGDTLHPSDEGSAVLANAIPLSIID